MDELRRLLQQGDPLRHDPGLTEVDVDRMRRAITAGAEVPARKPDFLALAIVAGLCAVVVAGTWLVRLAPEIRSTRPAAASSSVNEPTASPRQLQFSTPGGTRVIWVFDTSEGRNGQ
jgi:hypothetical protein